MNGLQYHTDPGDLVEVGGNAREMWHGCFAVVEEIRDWGIIGIVKVPDANASFDSHVRISWPDVVSVYKKFTL